MNEDQWLKLVGIVNSEFGRDLSNCITLKIIAAIPFEAGFENPEREALAKMYAYMAAGSKAREIFEHTPEDDKDILARIQVGLYNEHLGNKKIIKKGHAIIGLLLLESYKNDIEKDKANSHYNPLVSKAWDYKSIRDSLLKTIHKVQNDNLDSLYDKWYNKVSLTKLKNAKNVEVQSAWWEL